VFVNIVLKLYKVEMKRVAGKWNGRRHTNQPLPILQPTTPQAFPLALISRGKISAGYSHGTVSQVAPKTDVKTKTMEAAAAPYCDAFAVSPAAVASIPRREKPPARNMAIPCPTAPQ
jgi:hypothetical protein